MEWRRRHRARRRGCPGDHRGGPPPHRKLHESRAFPGLACVLCDVLLQEPSGTEALAREQGEWPRMLVLQSPIRRLAAPLRRQVTKGCFPHELISLC